MPFTQYEFIKRDVLETGMAAVRTGPMTQFLSSGANHQAIMVTDGVIVVQSQNDAAIR